MFVFISSVINVLSLMLTLQQMLKNVFAITATNIVVAIPEVFACVLLNIVHFWLNKPLKIAAALL